MQEKYWELADTLSDHLWMRNELDYNLLKEFPEFFYKGEGFRVLFLDQDDKVNLEGFTNKSFSTSKNGILEFIEKTETYNHDVQEGKIRKFYKGQIEGFNVQKAMRYFQKYGGLTENTIEAFIDEEEIISFQIKQIQEIEAF